MYEFINLHVLSSSDQKAYESLIPEQFHFYLKEKSSAIAIGASLKGKPIGVILAKHSRHLQLIDIVYIFVLPEHRNQGVGRQLLAKVQEEGKKAGGKIFSFVYPIGESMTPVIEKIISHNHWKGVRPFLIRCWFDVITFNIPWVMQHTFKYPPGYEEFSWNEATKEEIERLRHKQRQGHFFASVAPWREESLIEPLNSLGLRYKGEIVGWMITHRIAKDTIRYTSLYIDQHLKHHGLIMAKLLVDSMHLHLKDRVHNPVALLEIPLLQVSSAWKCFVEKKLIPYANKVERLVQAWG